MNNNLKGYIIITVGIVIAAIIFGSFFFQAQKPRNIINVVGIATKRFEADTIKWRITLEETANPKELELGYTKISEQYKKLMQELKNRGISVDNVNKKPVISYEEYNYNQDKERKLIAYRIQQSLYIITDKIDEIEELAFNPLVLLDKEIIIKNSDLQYYSSKIDQYKKEIIADAADNAGERAEKMLANTDVKIGRMLSINSGVFQITEPYSTRVSSGGIYDTSTRKKQIRVTVHAVFEIK